MGNLQSLTKLNVYMNNFTGPVSMLSSLTSLEFLDLGINQFTDSLDFLSGLSSLTGLYLFSLQAFICSGMIFTG